MNPIQLTGLKTPCFRNNSPLVLSLLLRAFPCGSHYSLYLFCLYRTKKDAAAIANAASEHLFNFTISRISRFLKIVVSTTIPNGINQLLTTIQVHEVFKGNYFNHFEASLGIEPLAIALRLNKQRII